MTPSSARALLPEPPSRAYAMGMPVLQQVEWTAAQAIALPPADLVFSPRRLVQPDIFVVPAREAGAPSGWNDVTSLLLAVEVLSPSTARADRHRKRLIYQEQGVAEYWIVDASARLVERWRPADSRPEQIVETLVWQPDPTVAGLIVELPAFFRAVHDEAARPGD